MTGAMQFGSCVFPHNPQSIDVTRSDRVARLFCPFRGAAVQHLGEGARTVRCRGCFFGETLEEAAAQLAAFRRAAEGCGARLLFLPGLESFPAVLESFAYEAAGDGRILPYTMTYVEAGRDDAWI